MSRVQPPGEPVPFLKPFGLLKATSGVGGHVVSVGERKSSIVNGALAKWLGNGVAVVVSLQVVLSGAVGLAPDCACRLMSSMYRHWNGVPPWLTCVVWAASAFAR